MIRMKVSTKLDTSGLKKLQKQLKNVHVDVGYIDSKDHWMSKVPVAQVASSLHDHSPWRDSFMLTETRKDQVQNIINSVVTQIGIGDTFALATSVGKLAKDQIAVNIQNVSSPANSAEWADIKGFNDPLVYGSKVGNTPNLISELTFKVGAG